MGDTNFVQYVEYVELLIMIGDTRFRKKGLGSNAVSLMIAHISRFIHGRVIQAFVCPDNIPCIKLLQSLGFKQQPGSLEDKVFVLPEEKRLEVEKTMFGSIVYRNECLIETLLNRSNEYHRTLLQ